MDCRRLLAAVVLCGAALTPALAADQSFPRGPTSYYPNAYYPTSVNWTGFYTGLQFGGVFGSTNWTDPLSGLSDDPNPSGIVGGGQIGVNWSSGGLLLGVEGDFTGMDLSGKATDGAGFTHEFRSTWLSLITGRVGYAAAQYLFYAKGGIAFANERNKVITPGGLAADSGVTTQYGWTFGGGLEYALDVNWSARLEYDFIDFPSRNVVLVGCAPIIGGLCHGPGALPANVDFNIHKVSAAVNYRF
jgi:outer membrane immunogenic protein